MVAGNSNTGGMRYHHTKHSSKASSGLPQNISQGHVTQSVQNLGKQMYQNTENEEEQTVERFIAETGNSQPNSFINNFDLKTGLEDRKNLN
jgi:hypothetical protein